MQKAVDEAPGRVKRTVTDAKAAADAVVVNVQRSVEVAKDTAEKVRPRAHISSYPMQRERAR